MFLIKRLLFVFLISVLFFMGGCMKKNANLLESDSGILESREISIKPITVSENPVLSQRIKEVVDGLGYNVKYKTEDGDDEVISITVMDLSKDAVEWGGLNPHKKSYPASAYKAFAAAEIFRRVAEGSLKWDDMITFDPKNHRGEDTVKGGEQYTLRYLVNTMLDLSDNSCANQCIDIADRKKINELLHQMGIMDSDVTRKYLPRKMEDEEYKDAPSTFGTSYDYALFYAILGKGYFVNKQTSQDFYNQLLKNQRNFSIPGGLPPTATFAHKSGFYGDFNIDAGIVKDGGKYYVLSIFFPEKTSTSNSKVHEIVKRIHELM